MNYAAGFWWMFVIACVYSLLAGWGWDLADRRKKENVALWDELHRRDEGYYDEPS